jgi:hypothetical protein
MKEPHRPMRTSRRLRAKWFVAAVAASAAFVLAAGVALAEQFVQNWSCSNCRQVYAPRAGNIYKLHGINYSRNGDVCVEVSGHSSTLRCNSNAATGSGVYWQGPTTYGTPVVSTDKGDTGALAGHSY